MKIEPPSSSEYEHTLHVFSLIIQDQIPSIKDVFDKQSELYASFSTILEDENDWGEKYSVYLFIFNSFLYTTVNHCYSVHI